MAAIPSFSPKALGVSPSLPATTKERKIRRRTSWAKAASERITLGSGKTPEEAFSVYKYAKELTIKYLAEKYKLELDSRAYTALINYTVEITD